LLRVVDLLCADIDAAYPAANLSEGKQIASLAATDLEHPHPA